MNDSRWVTRVLILTALVSLTVGPGACGAGEPGGPAEPPTETKAVAEAPAATRPATETKTQYLALFMAGKKTGYAKNTRSVAGGKVTTAQEFVMSINRGGMAMAIHTAETFVETVDGKPLSFKSVQDLGIMAQTLEGVIGADGTMTVTTSDGQTVRRRTMPWPKGALMVEGARLLDVKKGLAKGTRYTCRLFVPSVTRAMDVAVAVGDEVEVDLLGRVVRLTEVKATMTGPTGQMTMLNYVDREHEAQKVVTSIIGMQVEMIACSKEFATSPNDPFDFLDRMLVVCPISLEAAVRSKAVSYHLTSKDGSKLSVPSTDNQTAKVSASKTVVTVRPAKAPANATFPYKGKDTEVLKALKPTRFLQSDDDKIVALARKAVGKTTDAAKAARKIEAFVARYIQKKDLSVGYASASEVARSKQGDCTEHAVLVAAMCRAVGLPAEVVSGMVYVGDYRDRKNVFAPHAWNRVLVGDKWIGLDAAYGGHGAGHIALLTGQGDLDEFFGIVTTMGNFTIEEVVVHKK